MACDIDVTVDSTEIKVTSADEDISARLEKSQPVEASMEDETISSTFSDAQPIEVSSEPKPIWVWDNAENHYYLKIGETKVAIIDSNGNLIIKGRILNM